MDFDHSSVPLGRSWRAEIDPPPLTRLALAPIFRRWDPGRIARNQEWEQAMSSQRGSGSRHRLIVVADIEGFGDPGRTGSHLQAVRDGLDTVMRAAFAAAGVVWEDCYREMSGDAVVALAPADTDKTAFVETALPA